MTQNSSKQPRHLYGFAFVAFVAAIGITLFFAYAPNPKEGVTTSASSSVADFPGYCIAIRGNGELQPAHWGAMARTIEQLGLPSAMAGGSSATITMMLMEAIASNPSVKNQPVEMQKVRAALLWKSLLGYFGELKQTKEWAQVKALYGQIAEARNKEVGKVREKIDAKQLASAMSVLKQAIALGVVDVNTTLPLKDALMKMDQKRADFYVQQLQETASVFGKFNAQTDDNLFFRMGIVSFENGAVSLGKIASFYAAVNEPEDNEKTWEDFMNTCAPDSTGKSWVQIVTGKPTCAGLLHTLFLQTKSGEGHFEQRNVGSVIPSFPITSVLIGSAADDFREARKQYHTKLDPHFGKDFQVRRPEEVRIGYWGDSQRLQKMSSLLYQSDEKSRRFLPLGMAKWAQVLALSPAEPGLSPLKDFTTEDGKNYISAGGWPDLHPVAALKAAGCEDVVYLTRQGGESLFGQGVAKRLFRLERDWKYLDSKNEVYKKLNADGDPSDLNSPWSKLFNLANPQSSVNLSLSQASAVLCTDWNADKNDVKKNLMGLVEDAYRSSYWINPNITSAVAKGLTPVLAEKRPGCQGL